MSNNDSRALGGKIVSPIRTLVNSDEYGRVIFKVHSFKEMFNTRTAALGNKRRLGVEVYTKNVGSDELHVIKPGCESMPALVVDLNDYNKDLWPEDLV